MTSRPKFTYAAAGVDTDIEAQAAQIMYRYSKATWANRAGRMGEPQALGDGFSSVRYASIAGLPAGTVEWGNADGLGTKPEIARAAGRYDTMATDLIAMVADDAAIQGGEPAHVKTILTVNSLGQDRSRLPYIEELARGYVPAAASAGVAIINGELAQHNSAMGGDDFRFAWEATLTWYGHISRLIDGSKIRPGDAIIALEETGLRCNGISLVRKVLEACHGADWSSYKLGLRTLGEAALQPSRIYAGALVDMTGGADLARPAQAPVHGAVHVTGGGIPEKLVYRCLRKRGLGAVIDEPYEAPAIMRHCQEIAEIPDAEAYRAWNMGQGMLIITPDPAAVLAVTSRHKLPARVIGRITAEPVVRLTSRGRDGGELTYEVGQ